MSAADIVLSKDLIKLFAGREGAFKLASKLTNSQFESANVESHYDSDIIWTSLVNKDVKVRFQNILIEENYNCKFNPLWMISDESPAGWTYGNVPIKIEYAKKNPNNVKPLFSLTEEQKWGLSIALVNSIDYFNYCDTAFINYEKSDCLIQLKQKTYVGLEIRDFILEKLFSYISNPDD